MTARGKSRGENLDGGENVQEGSSDPLYPQQEAKIIPRDGGRLDVVRCQPSRKFDLGELFAHANLMMEGAVEKEPAARPLGDVLLLEEHAVMPNIASIRYRVDFRLRVPLSSTKLDPH